MSSHIQSIFVDQLVISSPYIDTTITSASNYTFNSLPDDSHQHFLLFATAIQIKTDFQGFLAIEGIVFYTLSMHLLIMTAHSYAFEDILVAV